MTYLTQPYANWRAPRLRLTDHVPVVLRMPDGGRHRGKLETISLNGGLLNMTHSMNQGSRITLMFVTRSGPVLGTAEMLSPISWWQQPFRFVTLQKEDQRRLRDLVQPSANLGEEPWIAKYRAASSHRRPERRAAPRFLLGSLTFLALLGSVLYLLNFHFLR